ncbi:hypothetical protein P6144_18440 [Sphingomonas sp. HITSZ_GF]|uniref:c-type cytochrome n=1 Tax=Sphingomonas sp. HITSZ_GF TaxID=3037247 RepID=UPI00240E892A|nr:hypothetical protein [Sphingomonas sp. HITSZ_GF]MDG2535647.1 hypothetical protein [Sphingomonas sp. HITSZ_GF]
MTTAKWLRNYGVLSVAGVALVLGAFSNSTAWSQEEEPIAFVGHGAFFDSSGKEIAPTPEFLERAERWYERRIIPAAEKSAEFDATMRKLTRGLELSSYERLFAKQAALSWMANNLLPDRVDGRTRGKLRALEYRMRRTLVGKGMKALFNTNKEAISTELLLRVDALPVTDKAKTFKSLALAPGDAGTVNGGKAYVDECAAAGVPIPPPIGRMESPGVPGWKSQGFIEPDLQFIEKTPAELRSFENAQGMCYALPRYAADVPSRVDLDGVICFSKTTAKACFWDNQMEKGSFSFQNGTVIPIGYPDRSINSDGWYQAGGADLIASAGGICTDCHVGDNPYIVHPKAVLRAGMTWGAVQNSLPAFAPGPYVPLVLADWPQNAPAAPEGMVPANCASCHSPDGEGGRLPALSPAFARYCNTILRQALTTTMPPRTPGSQLGKPDVEAYLALCQAPASPQGGR